jgi:hypothetical protein
MRDLVADKNPDISAAADRDESTGLMEPMLESDGSKHKSALSDLALTLASAAFRSSLPAGVMHALADLVPAMNCYYSNLIEGHNTHPVDIERALKDDYSANPEKRNLQLEARAHIAVQAWIDGGAIKGVATNADTLRAIHRRFCELLPGELLFAEDPKTAEKVLVVPGQLRQRDVKVGRHIPVSPGAVPRFLARFEEAYRRLGRIDSVLAAAAAHHRFAWMLPHDINATKSTISANRGRQMPFLVVAGQRLNQARSQCQGVQQRRTCQVKPTAPFRWSCRSFQPASANCGSQRSTCSDAPE